MKICILCFSSFNQTLYYIEELRKMYPEAELTAFCTSLIIGQVTNIPEVSKTFCVQKRGRSKLAGRLEFIKKLFMAKTDLMVISLDGLPKKFVLVLELLTLISNSRVKFLAKNYRLRKFSPITLLLEEIWYILRIIGRLLDSFLAGILLFFFLIFTLIIKFAKSNE